MFKPKQKLLALALAACTSAALADSNVTLYGRLDVAAQNNSFDGNQNYVQPSTYSVQDYGSYFGIRGSDQVYGDTAAIWQVEQFLDISSGQPYGMQSGGGWVPSNPSNNGMANAYNNYGAGQVTQSVNTFASSDSYLGLQGAWGKIRIGNLSNTFRTDTGAVDVYNGAYANVLGTYDRFAQVMPATARFDSPTWNNFHFGVAVSFNDVGSYNTGGLGNGSGYNWASINGFNDSPTYNFGLAYTPGYFSVTWNTQIAQNIGTYAFQTGQQGMGPAGSGNGLWSPTNTGVNGAGQNPMPAYNAYVSRLEIAYNDPDSFFIGGGLQVSNGYGWQGAAGFGNQNNITLNPANYAVNGANPGAGFAQMQCTQAGSCPAGVTNLWALNTAVVQTQELGATFGWHLGQWTPKISYMYGNNWMSGANPWQLVTGTGNQIGGTGYNQMVGELDWNITPATIVYVNYGQIWYGNVAGSMQYGSAYSGTYYGGYGNNGGSYDWSAANGLAYANVQTAAIGFSHTF